MARTYINRSEIGLITDNMLVALRLLADAKKNDMPFVALVGVRSQTIRALHRRDWIIVSKGLDGTRYRITGRGLKALSVFETPSGKRFDNICTACNVNPRGEDFPSGAPRSYCHDCERKLHNEYRQKHGSGHNPDSPCSTCKQQKRHIYPSGLVCAYCVDCLRERNRRERQIQRERIIERIQNGETILCTHCKQEPIYIAGKTTYSQCYSCFRETQNKSAKKQKAKRFANKINKGAKP